MDNNNDKQFEWTDETVNEFFDWLPKEPSKTSSAYSLMETFKKSKEKVIEQPIAIPILKREDCPKEFLGMFDMLSYANKKHTPPYNSIEGMKDNKIELLKEDIECVHKYLDDKNVPRVFHNETYSIVGRIKQLENKLAVNTSIENLKPKQEKECDYEIQCFVGGSYNYWIQKDGLYKSGAFEKGCDKYYFINNGFKIHSVLRKSDKTVLSIGSETNHGVITYFIIYNNGSIHVHIRGNNGIDCYLGGLDDVTIKTEPSLDTKPLIDNIVRDIKIDASKLTPEQCTILQIGLHELELEVGSFLRINEGKYTEEDMRLCFEVGWNLLGMDTKEKVFNDYLKTLNNK